MKRVFALCGVLLVSACAAPAAPPSPPPPAPVAAAPTPALRPSAPPDSCGAAASQHLVGRNRSEIPVPVSPGRQRVACTTCPVTQDLNPSRLNFFFDADTGVIREIRCG